MSPRAAWQLEAFGYQTVLDYSAGKADWLAFNLPREGEADLVGDHVQSVPTVDPEHPLNRDLQGLLERSGRVVVTNRQGVVMGSLDAGSVPAGPEMGRGRVGEVMALGPTSVRPSEEVDPLAHRLQHAGTGSVLVTRSDGVLLGEYRVPGR